MKSSILAAILAVVVGSAGAVLTWDNPAPFRGEDGTTLQVWEFGSPAQVGVAPDVIVNPYGTASADIEGNFANNTVWLAQDPLQASHTGVWVIDPRDGSQIIFTIDNSNVPNPVKNIWVQVVYSAAPNRPPMIYVLPEGVAQQPIDVMALVGVTAIDDMYSHATYSLTIQPNPSFEKIYLRARDFPVYIDAVLIETQCIPEPMTLSMLGLGVLVLLRKRR